MSPNVPTGSEAFQTPERAEAFRRMIAVGRDRNRASTDLMLEWADLRLGARVLDLAVGTGAQTLLIAPRVAPGEVVATDISASMLALAADAVREARLGNVTIRQMDAQQLDFPDESFDTAICRLGLMFMPDVDRAFREIRRVLRPGGKLAAVVFSDASRNPHSALTFSIGRWIGGLPEPPANAPGMLALGGPGVFEGAFQRAGFRDVRVQPVPFPARFTSLAEAMVDRRTTPSVVMIEILDQLTPEQQERYWVELEDAYRQFDGPAGFEAPGEQLVGVGTR